MISSSRGSYELGHTHATMELGKMKLEFLVIVDWYATLNMYLGPVHTTCHTLGIGFT